MQNYDSNQIAVALATMGNERVEILITLMDSVLSKNDAKLKKKKKKHQNNPELTTFVNEAIQLFHKHVGGAQ